MKLEQKWVWVSERTYAPRTYIKMDLLDYTFMALAILSFIGCYFN